MFPNISIFTGITFDIMLFVHSIINLRFSVFSIFNFQFSILIFYYFSQTVCDFQVKHLSIHFSSNFIFYKTVYQLSKAFNFFYDILRLFTSQNLRNTTIFQLQKFMKRYRVSAITHFTELVCKMKV